MDISARNAAGKCHSGSNRCGERPIWFLAALLVRIVAAFFVTPRMQEPAATSTLETVKEVMPELAQSFANLITRPVLPRGSGE